MQATIGDGVTTWALLDPDAAHGRGAVMPRLSLQFKARTCRERMQVQIHVIRGALIEDLRLADRGRGEPLNRCG